MNDARCKGKRQFLTFTQANGAARNATRHNNEPMRAYMCRDCHKFHIGNKPPGEIKKHRPVDEDDKRVRRSYGESS